MAEKSDIARKILNVTINNDITNIKKAFWLLAMKYHPDKNPGNKESHKQFINIVNAYEYLTKRKESWTPENTNEEKIGKYLSNEWGYYCWWVENYAQN